MAASCFVDSFDISTAAAGNTQAITGTGFTPKVVIFWWSGIVSSVDADGRGNYTSGIGVAISSTDRRCQFRQAADAQAAAVTDAGQTDAACIAVMDTAGAVVGLMDLQSMDADGFTLVIDDAFPNAIRVSYMAIGGADITNQVSGVFTSPAATGNQSISTLAFQPDFVLFFGTQQNLDGADTQIDSIMCIGAAVSSTEQAVWAGGSNDGAATMQAISYAINGECYAFLTATVTSTNGRATFVSMDANGFTINWLELGAAAQGLRIYYLAVKGGQWQVGDLLTQTDTVTDIVESGFGFQPKGAMLVSHCKAKNTADTASDHDGLSVGAFSSTTQRASHSTLCEDAVANSEVTRGVQHDEVYLNLIETPVSGNIDGLMDIKSVDADGFTCIMDDADTAQAFVWYFAVGDNAGGGGGGLVTRKTLLGVGI